jgi:hypothetical protein
MGPETAPAEILVSSTVNLPPEGSLSVMSCHPVVDSVPAVGLAGAPAGSARREKRERSSEPSGPAKGSGVHGFTSSLVESILSPRPP